MSTEPTAGTNRRQFLGDLLALGAAASLPTPLSASAAPATAATSGLAGAASEIPVYVYRSLGPDEALLVEALVEVMCPADALTPGGVACGLAAYIDGQLAGPFGRGDFMYRRGPWIRGKAEQGYQSPMTPEEYFKTGLAAANRAAVAKRKQTIAELEPAAADAFLHEIASGAVTDDSFDLRLWFDSLVYPLFVEACFADPVYGGNRDKVFWKMLGYPGLPAVYGRDIVTYRGKPHPAAAAPKSMAEFS